DEAKGSQAPVGGAPTRRKEGPHRELPQWLLQALGVDPETKSTGKDREQLNLSDARAPVGGHQAMCDALLGV
ncbi:unnamed protein product, partial [Polarella glacialis]